MNSEVKSFNLGQPMKWAEFCEMSEDLQREYIIRLRNLYSASIGKLSRMFGVHEATVYNKLKALNIEKLPTRVRCSPEWDSFVKYGTPRGATPLGDLIPTELTNAKKKHSGPLRCLCPGTSGSRERRQ